MDLNTLRQETLASALTTTAQDGATAFGLHAGTEAELAFARALGWLVGALHVVKKSLRAGQDVWKMAVCQSMICISSSFSSDWKMRRMKKNILLRNPVALRDISS